MLADNPKVALAAVVHAMALGVFYDERGASKLQITPRVAYLDRHAEGMDGTEAAKQLAATTKAMRKRLPKQASKLWAWLQNQQQKTLLALLAVCAGHTVDAVAKNGGDSGEHAAQLAAALKLDMADYWQPTAAGYFSRVSKEQTLAAIEDACGASIAGQAGCVENTVKACIAWLEERGALTWSHTARKHQSGRMVRSSNLYKLILDFAGATAMIARTMRAIWRDDECEWRPLSKSSELECRNVCAPQRDNVTIPTGSALVITELVVARLKPEAVQYLGF